MGRGRRCRGGTPVFLAPSNAIMDAFVDVLLPDRGGLGWRRRRPDATSSNGGHLERLPSG